MIGGMDFLALAERLIQGPVEADWRSAVSRAYYAAFHEARQLLASLGFRAPRADQAHAYLWLRLSNCGHAQVQLAGSQLYQLRFERNRADYDIGLNLAQVDMTPLVQNARRVIQLFAAARIEPTRTQITEAMKTYERDVLKQVTWTP